jgi:hypothetical protein
MTSAPPARQRALAILAGKSRLLALARAAAIHGGRDGTNTGDHAWIEGRCVSYGHDQVADEAERDVLPTLTHIRALSADAPTLVTLATSRPGSPVDCSLDRST